MATRKCPSCKKENLKQQEITKGNKVVGLNLFCPGKSCSYEKDSKNDILPNKSD